jgi:hypothetical protein
MMSISSFFSTDIPPKPTPEPNPPKPLIPNDPPIPEIPTN